MASLRPVSAEEIESLAIGAWILGTGGGGSPYLALLNMRQLYRDGAVVSLMDPMDLADDDHVAVVSNMGAPLVGQERLTDPRTIARAVTMMEEYLGRPFRAIMSLEIGGGNAIQPFMAAALLDRPVVDADCMGRAFPEAQMTSFAIHDLPMFPLTLVDVRDNAVVVARAASWKWMERLSRTACVAVGSIAATCKAPRTGKEVKSAPSSTRRARRSGSAGPCRPHGRRIAIPSRRSSRPSAGCCCSPGRSPTWPAARPRGSCGARPPSTGSASTAAIASSSPSRTSSRWAGSTASPG